MPSVVSPAQVKTGNGANMYVPIDGNTAVFPPILETPSVNGSNINGLGAPFLISTSVIVNGRSPYEAGRGALFMDGPMYINYDLNPDNPYVPTLDVSGNTLAHGEVIGRSLVIAQDTFKIPIGFHDFQGLYNLGPTYCMDFGGSRWLWGETTITTPGGGGTAVLELNSVPANTFANLEKNNINGIFDPSKSIVAGGCINNLVTTSLTGHYFYGVLTIPNAFNVPPFAPGNLSVWLADTPYNVSFFAIGLPNTA
jgi:hypothetical protein